MRTPHLAHYPNVFEEETKKDDTQSQPVEICFDLDVKTVGHELWLETWNTGLVLIHV